MSFWHNQITFLQTRIYCCTRPLFRLFAVTLIGISISSCGSHDQPGAGAMKPVKAQVSEPAAKPVSNDPETATAQPDRQSSTVEGKKPALDLSLENLADDKVDNGINLDTDQRFTEEDSPLAATLNKKKPATGVKLGGKLFTDDTKLENKQYLDSLEGVQVNIEGNFN
jgi:hypothetical protein